LENPTLRETLEPILGPELTSALEGRGFQTLTPVQDAVLAPSLDGHDLRISSQTGSGKTVAIGLVVRAEVRAATPGADPKAAHPGAIVVTPTRELAKQVEEELAWLYAPVGARVVSVTGGAGYRDELRSFRHKPAVVVGTPGRLLDHLKRGSIDASAAAAIVLDEADRMLDMGFREDIEAILGFLPTEHRTHLVSATFPREVLALADKVQSEPVRIEGTPLGTANQDIEHLLHLVEPKERLAAIVNLLLEDIEGQTLIFVRTRADVADLANALSDAGFAIAMLSGEMEQAERNRALQAFKRGHVDALVATDVAARGIDVSDVTRVLHVEPPSDPDAYTHRSGRTGRAGRKGTSSVLVTRAELARTVSLLGRARVRFRFAPVPSAESLRDARDEQLIAMLTADFVEGQTIDERSLAVAERILSADDPRRAVGRLVALARKRAQAEPREITPVAPPTERKPPRANDTWVPFRVSWGASHGAEARRLVAMMCRRGNIEGRDIGAIRIGRTSSVVEVATRVAAAFEALTSKPDPRDPRIHIRRWVDAPDRGEDGASPRRADEAPRAHEGPATDATRPRRHEAPPPAPRERRSDEKRGRDAAETARVRPKRPDNGPRVGQGFGRPKHRAKR